MTETGNRTLEQELSDIVNLLVKQKGGKRGIVKSVDEETLVCSVDPDDKSAPIEGAKLSAEGNAVIAIPKIGSKVALIPLHMEDDSENDWGVIQVSIITKYFIRADEEIEMFCSDIGKIKITSSGVELGGRSAKKEVACVLDNLVPTMAGPMKIQPTTEDPTNKQVKA